MAGRAIDEEARRDDDEAQRKLAGDRQILLVAPGRRIDPGQDRAEDEDPDGIEGLELCRRPIPEMDAEYIERRIDVAQGKQVQRSRHLLVEDEIEHCLHDQHEGGDQAGAFAALAGGDQPAEDADDRDGGDIDEGTCNALVFEDVG